MVLKDICCGRTIEWELGVFGKIYSALPCAPYIVPLHVSRIKSLWTDAIVSWDVNALLRLCVGVREAVVGVVAPDRGDLVAVIPGGGGGRFFGAHWCRGWRSCGVIQSASADTPSSAPAGSGSCISVARWLGVLHLTPRQ